VAGRRSPVAGCRLPVAIVRACEFLCAARALFSRHFGLLDSAAPVAASRRASVAPPDRGA
ncbi:hypothetical protein, partial [Burkholderia sp. BCC1974]|uniref:hypothetical protein n=1 Tax=Burkholderia sp. BCC1974 TaxID=2817439 RepID=UPI002ABDD770